MKKTVFDYGDFFPGLGKTAAKYFAERDWNIVATMRTPEREKDLVGFKRCIGDAAGCAGRRRHSISNLQKALRVLGKIDALINNAGFGLFGVF